MKRIIFGILLATISTTALAQSTQQPGPGPQPPSSGGSSVPSGPAGGDLGGTYPDPTVQSISRINAGGDLGSSYPNPTVLSVAHVNTGVLGVTHGGAGTISGALKANGSGTVSQAACADLSNGATGCSTATGTSGATLPILNGTNTWSGLQTQTGLTTTTPGWYVGLDTDTVPRVRIGLDATDVPLLAFGPGGSTARDTFFERAAAANMRFGAPAVASPVAQTVSVQNVVAGTSNTAGANLTIAGSQGTGTGAGGSILLQTAPPGTTGTSQNALSTALTISGATGQPATFTGSVTATGFSPTGSTCPTNGMYLSAANTLALCTNSSARMTFGSSGTINAVGAFLANNNSGWRLNNVAATATVPTINPLQSDTATGLGSNGTGTVSIIAASTEVQRVIATGTELIVAASDSGHTDATVCRDTTSGLLYAGSGTAGVCLGTSSIRYKTGFKPLDTKKPSFDALSVIMALRPGEFRYKRGYGDGGARLQLGVLAEDVAKAAPMLVDFDAAGLPNAVDYMGLVPLLVRAVQEQQAEIKALRKELHRQ